MNISKMLLVVLVSAILLISCSLSQKPEREALSEIYSDVLAYEFSYGSRGSLDYCSDNNLIFSSVTESYSFVGDDLVRVKSYFPELEQDTWTNFLQVNSQSSPLPGDLDISCSYALMNVKENPSDWSSESCTGIYYFSQAGFNSRKNQALVYRGFSCGEFAYGNLYFLEIIDGQWKVTDMRELYIT